MEVHAKLEKYLDENGLRKNWFAEKLGLSPAGLTNILSGIRRCPPKYWSKIFDLTQGAITFEDFLVEELNYLAAYVDCTPGAVKDQCIVSLKKINK